MVSYKKYLCAIYLCVLDVVKCNHRHVKRDLEEERESQGPRSPDRMRDLMTKDAAYEDFIARMERTEVSVNDAKDFIQTKGRVDWEFYELEHSDMFIFITLVTQKMLSSIDPSILGSVKQFYSGRWMIPKIIRLEYREQKRCALFHCQCRRYDDYWCKRKTRGVTKVFDTCDISGVPDSFTEFWDFVETPMAPVTPMYSRASLELPQRGVSLPESTWQQGPYR